MDANKVDAKKVLRYLYELRTIKHDEKHIYDCLLEQLIAALEHEAQAEPGGWKPGSEPPEHSRYVHLLLDTEIHEDGKKRYGQTFGHYDPVSGIWLDHYGTRRDDVLFYYDAPPPPLPEQAP